MNQCCIAVDLGGSRLRVALVDSQGAIAWRLSVPTLNEGSPAGVIDQIEALIATQPPSQIAGIAVAAPGPLNTRDGLVLRIPTLAGWENVRLRDLLQQRFSAPVFIENDAIAAAVGQWRHGAGRGTNNLVYLTISTGIGGGIISNGQVLRGSRGYAGHLGHLLLYPDSSTRCACGRTGCFEAHASGRALDARAQKMSTLGSRACRAMWADVTVGRRASAIDLAKAAQLGHAPSLDIWQEQGVCLAQGICSIVHALDPEVVVLGGGVSKSYALFGAALQEHLEARLMPEFSRVRVEPAEQPQDAGLLGVASLLFDELSAGPPRSHTMG